MRKHICGQCSTITSDLAQIDFDENGCVISVVCRECRQREIDERDRERLRGMTEPADPRPDPNASGILSRWILKQWAMWDRFNVIDQTDDRDSASRSEIPG